MHWLIDNWLAVIALIVAFFGGWPGALKIVEHFRPISLSGSIKCFTCTTSTVSPRFGALLALTLLNDGSKNLVWRNLRGTFILDDGRNVSTSPMLIPPDLHLIDQQILIPDLMTQQVIPPQTPINCYLLLTADEPFLDRTPSKVTLQFKLESSKSLYLDLRFEGVHPVQPGEVFPTHSLTF